MRSELPVVLRVGAVIALGVTARVARAEGPSRAEVELPDAAQGELSETEVIVGHLGHTPAPTASATEVTGEDFHRAPRRSAEDALRLVPGMALVQHGSEGKGLQYLLRGFDAGHGADFEVTADGVPLNEWSNIHAQGYLDLAFLPAEVIRSVRVTKGPFRTEQGAFAMAGSADYSLGLLPDQTGARVSYTAGTTNRHRAAFTFSPTESLGRDFVATEVLGDAGFGEQRTAARASTLAKWRLYTGDGGGELSVLGSGYVGRFELPTALRNDDVENERIGFYDSYDDRQRGLSAKGLLGLTYSKARQGPRPGRVDLSVYGSLRRLDLIENATGYLDDPINGDNRHQRHDDVGFGVIASHQVSIHRHWSLQSGLGLRGDVLSQTQSQVGLNLEELDRQLDLGASQLLGHARFATTYRPHESVRIDAGVRVDVANLRTESRLESEGDASTTTAALSPRATLAYSVAKPLDLFLSYGRGFRPPDARSVGGTPPDRIGVADEALPSTDSITTSDAIEVGAHLAAGRVELRATGLATFLEREAVFDHVSGSTVELGATRRWGGEFVVVTHPLPILELSADMTLIEARFVETGTPVPFAPWLSGGARVFLDAPSRWGKGGRWRSGLRLVAIAPRDLPLGARGAAYSLLDASFGHHFRRFHVDMEVENLLGLRLRDGEGNYASRWDRTQPESRLPAVHFNAAPPLNGRLTLTFFY